MRDVLDYSVRFLFTMGVALILARYVPASVSAVDSWPRVLRVGADPVVYSPRSLSEAERFHFRASGAVDSVRHPERLLVTDERSRVNA